MDAYYNFDPAYFSSPDDYETGCNLLGICPNHSIPHSWAQDLQYAGKVEEMPCFLCNLYDTGPHPFYD